MISVYPERTARRKVVWPLKAIRSKCLQCVESPQDVAECCSTGCPLWPYRYGMTYEKALRQGRVVDPNTEAAHRLRDQWL